MATAFDTSRGIASRVGQEVREGKREGSLHHVNEPDGEYEVRFGDPLGKEMDTRRWSVHMPPNVRVIATEEGLPYDQRILAIYPHGIAPTMRSIEELEQYLGKYNGRVKDLNALYGDVNIYFEIDPTMSPYERLSRVGNARNRYVTDNLDEVKRILSIYFGEHADSSQFPVAGVRFTMPRRDYTNPLTKATGLIAPFFGRKRRDEKLEISASYNNYRPEVGPSEPELIVGVHESALNARHVRNTIDYIVGQFTNPDNSETE